MMNNNGSYDKSYIDETDEPSFVPAPLWDNIKRKSRLGQRGKLHFPGITTSNNTGISTHVVKEPSVNFQEWISQAPIKKSLDENKENVFRNASQSLKCNEISSKNQHVPLQYSKFWNDLDINKITDPNGFINVAKLSVLPQSVNSDAKSSVTSTSTVEKPYLSDESKTNFSYPVHNAEVSPLNLSVPKIQKTDSTQTSSHSFPFNNKCSSNDHKLEISGSSTNSSSCSSPLSVHRKEDTPKEKLSTTDNDESKESNSVKTENEVVSEPAAISPPANIGAEQKSKQSCSATDDQPRPQRNSDFPFERPQPVLPIPKSSHYITIQGISYQVLNELGRGGSSKVYQVLNSNCNQLLAIKKVDLTDLDPMIANGYLNEVKLLNSLQHCDSVIKMIDSEVVVKNRKKLLFVVMEKGETDLSKLIRDISKTEGISISMIAHYWSEMLKAVESIHKSGIIHSDLKPANFLLVSGRLKLIDFGIASKIQSDMTSVHKEFATGTWNYMSPEALKNTNSSSTASIYKITYKSDVWSLGCILYNLVYGRTPFQHITQTLAKLQAIVDPKLEINFPNKEVPPGLMIPLKLCLQKDPKMRPTVSQLLSDVTNAFKYFGCANDNGK